MARDDDYVLEHLSEAASVASGRTAAALTQPLGVDVRPDPLPTVETCPREEALAFIGGPSDLPKDLCPPPCDNRNVLLIADALKIEETSSNIFFALLPDTLTSLNRLMNSIEAAAAKSRGEAA